MHRKRHNHHHNLEYRSPVLEHDTIEFHLDPPPTITQLLERRASPSKTCAPDDTSPRCEKPAAANNSALPIILGSAIPIVCAIFVLLWLHRRHTLKLKQEIINDKTKSMDFGMEFPSAGGKGPKKPNGEKKTTNRRQLSMDLDNPYLLAPGLRGSRESLQSLGRTMNGGDDRYGYRPGTSYSNTGPTTPGHASQRNYAPSHHSNLAHSRGRDSSIYEHSIKHDDDSPNGSTMSMSAELLRGAQKMPMSSPPPPRNASLPTARDTAPTLNLPTSPAPAVTRPLSPGLPAALQVGLTAGPNSDGRDSYIDNDSGDLRRSHLHLASHIDSKQNPQANQKPSTDSITNQPGPSITVSEPAHLAQPAKAETRPISDASDYADDANPDIEFRFSTASEEHVPQPAPRKPTGRDTLAPGAYDSRRLSMGFRPLPPDGIKDESAEERAMRIRSFYKEYFDDSAPEARPTSHIEPHIGYAEGGEGGGYYDVADDYMPGHQDDSAPVYDPASDRYVIPGSQPFAEPPTRRAMTPPPRMPPQFQPQMQGPRAPSAQSGRFMPPGPRSFSSASGRMGPPHMRGPPPPRRPFIPPQPLHGLPTPAALREDSFASPIMFAPPPRIQEVVAGAGPGSPSLRPAARPYSPSVSPHIPLASAFDELQVLAAPHSLRKSGTYTALDFAPPRKFKNEDSMSDAGSIRSNKSGLNHAQMQGIRAGAYRVSRIPIEVVPLKDEMTAHLRPTMDLSKR